MKLFLSSAECGQRLHGFEQMKKYHNKYYLYSYYNIRKTPEYYLDVTGEVFLDSGAHTLQKPSNTVDWEKYLSEYITFINTYAKHINYIVELDIENKVGMPLVEQWTRKITQQTGRIPIIVWHRGRGFDYLQYMAKTYPYIGFSGFVEDKTGEDEVPRKFINTFCDIAHKNNSKVHAFGYTRADLHAKRFDSADSSSWTMFKRFGSTDIFKNTHMTRYKQIRGYGDKYVPMADWNVQQWIKYQTYLDGVH